MRNIIVLFVIGSIMFSCKEKQPIAITSEDYHNASDHLTSIIVHDIFSPPVASRIYAYSNLAAYEAICQQDSVPPFFTEKLNAYKVFKTNVSDVNWELSSLIAFMEVGQKMIFSEEKMIQYKDSLNRIWKEKNATEYEKARIEGEKVAQHILEYASADLYKETRTMPKYAIQLDTIAKWQPTPPSYMDGIEPHWGKIRPFLLTNLQDFVPVPPPIFSMETGSEFHKELVEVYKIGNEIQKDTGKSEKKEIAKFWDCNPYVATQKGHMMFATKKITPGGHWIGICKIACEKANTNYATTIKAYSKVSIAMADAFISCWKEKYRSNLTRPETLINTYIDEQWFPILQTPPFPEYTSGHSVVSGAASRVLTSIFGENFDFEDTTEVPYGLPVRKFSSFEDAANEAAISRLYGGIHYRSAVDHGLHQGIIIGNYFVKNLE